MTIGKEDSARDESSLLKVAGYFIPQNNHDSIALLAGHYSTVFPAMRRHAAGSSGNCRVSRTYTSHAGAASGLLRCPSAPHCQSLSHIRRTPGYTRHSEDSGAVCDSRTYTKITDAVSGLLKLLSWVVFYLTQ